MKPINPYAGREVGEVSSMMRRITAMVRKYEEREAKKLMIRQEIAISAPRKRQNLPRAQWSSPQKIAAPFLEAQPVGTLLTPKQVKEATGLRSSYVSDTLCFCTAYEKVKTGLYRRIEGPIEFTTKRNLT